MQYLERMIFFADKRSTLVYVKCEIIKIKVNADYTTISRKH